MIAALPDLLSDLATIVLLDLVLAGDNAMMIALAAHRLNPQLRARAVLWGTIGAVGVRVLLTFVTSLLFELPGLGMAGGMLLLPIAWKLLQPAPIHAATQPGESAVTLGAALRTIIVADALMGLDNVLAIAGAADGHLLLVLAGLGISVPLVVWGSTLVLKLIDRFPAVIYLGAAMIAFTAARMIAHDRLVAGWFANHAMLTHAFELGLALLACVAGIWRRHR